MAKAKMYGMNKTFIPNHKADMRFRKKIYQRGKEFADRAEERTADREMKNKVKQYG